MNKRINVITMCIRVSLQMNLEFIEIHGPLTGNTDWKCLTKEEEKRTFDILMKRSANEF